MIKTRTVRTLFMALTVASGCAATPEAKAPEPAVVCPLRQALTLRDRLAKSVDALIVMVDTYRTLVSLTGREDLNVQLRRARYRFETYRFQLVSELPVDEGLLTGGMEDLAEFERLLSHRE